MPFLRNEFSKIFEDLFTMTDFTVDVDILELVGCKMSVGKLLRVKWTHESLPKA